MRLPFCLLLAAGLAMSLTPADTSAQDAPPSTDILLVSMKDGQIVLQDDEPLNLTDRDGYDNQPFLTPDGQGLLYTAFYDGQTDIYRFDLKTRTATQLTDTPESEYSPTPLPAADGFSTIRVEADGRQRLWSFDGDGTNPVVALEAVAPVGYHAWADSFTVLLFILGEPPTLQQADARTGIADTVAFNVGRSLHRVPGTGVVSFVHKEAEDRWVIKTRDPASGAIAAVDLSSGLFQSELNVRSFDLSHFRLG